MPFLLLVVMIMSATLAGAAGLPGPAVPDGLGVNIHFTGAPARDLDLLQAGGFRFIRMDFPWAGVEKEKGKYDFAPYDALTAGLEQRGMRALYILDYGNPLYEAGNSVQTEAGRQAFARFAAAAAEHFRGRGIVWELWNEPNIKPFWTPEPDVNQYMALAKVVFPAIRAADPQAICIGPGTSGLPREFLGECFRQGLLDLVDAVSVHPYRNQPPETAARDILALRALIGRYAPARADVPIISGEWGYSSVWDKYDPARQGRYLSREFLTNLSLGIPLSIWYDWHDDGPDPKESEHHFGTVTLDYQPKPAYLAMQELVRNLGGLRFVRRLQSAAEDYLLLFSDGRRHVLATWTLLGGSHETEAVPGMRLTLTETVAYLPLDPLPKAIAAQAAWSARARWQGVRLGAAPGEPLSPEIAVQVRNPFPQAAPVMVRIKPGPGLQGALQGPARFVLRPEASRTLVWRGRVSARAREDLSVAVEVEFAGIRSRQVVPLLLFNPVHLQARRTRGGALEASIDNPDGDALQAALVARAGDRTLDCRVTMGTARGRVTMGDQDLPVRVEANRLTVTLPLRARGGDKVWLALREGGRTIAADHFRAVPVPGLDVPPASCRQVEGDRPERAAFSFSRLPDSWAMAYDCPPGWALAVAPLPRPVPLTGSPREIGAWVKGDGTDVYLCLRYTDAAGRTFEPLLGRIDFSGWRYLSARLDDPTNDLVAGPPGPLRVAFPVTIDAIVLSDSNKAAAKGRLEIAGWEAVYRE